MTKKLLTLDNIRSGALPSDAHAVGFLLGEVERLQKQMEILQRANRFLSEQIPSALEPGVGRAPDCICVNEWDLNTPGGHHHRACPLRDTKYTQGSQGASRDLSASESASFHKTLARSPRRIGAGIPPDGAPSMPEGASRDASSEPYPDFMYCSKCGELYTGRGGQDGFQMTLTCPNQHSWTDPRPTELRTFDER